MVVSNGIKGSYRHYEISWYQTGPLMNQLIKGMLAIGSWFTPDNGTSMIIHLKQELFSFLFIYTAYIQIYCCNCNLISIRSQWYLCRREFAHITIELNSEFEFDSSLDRNIVNQKIYKSKGNMYFCLASLKKSPTYLLL